MWYKCKVVLFIYVLKKVLDCSDFYNKNLQPTEIILKFIWSNKFNG
jgi:hypothetical protein